VQQTYLDPCSEPTGIRAVNLPSPPNTSPVLHSRSLIYPHFFTAIRSTVQQTYRADAYRAANLPYRCSKPTVRFARKMNRATNLPPIVQ